MVVSVKINIFSQALIIKMARNELTILYLVEIFGEDGYSRRILFGLFLAIAP
jgi:hypothetical protein